MQFENVAFAFEHPVPAFPNPNVVPTPDYYAFDQTELFDERTGNTFVGGSLEIKVRRYFNNEFSRVETQYDWRSLWTKVADNHYRLDRVLPADLFAVTVPIPFSREVGDIGNTMTIRLSENLDGTDPWVSLLADSYEDDDDFVLYRIASEGQTNDQRGNATVPIEVREQWVTSEDVSPDTKIEYRKTDAKPENLYLHVLFDGDRVPLMPPAGTVVTGLSNHEIGFRPTCPRGACELSNRKNTTTYWTPTLTAQHSSVTGLGTITGRAIWAAAREPK